MTAEPTVSVLMAVHGSDNAAHFADALESLCAFVERLSSVVLVVDGDLPAALEAVMLPRLDRLRLDVVRLPRSVGLGEALNAGLEHCPSEFVLRMDADDISHPDRLQVLLARLSVDPSIDALGSYIAEFDDDPRRPHAVRQVPLAHDDIARAMRLRCVMNHVSCLLRRRAVLDVGGYAGGRGFAEDWWLWARLLRAGCRFANVDQVLVDVRVGNGFLHRRRGWRMLRQDFRLIGMMHRIGFIGVPQAILLAAIKLVQRSLPRMLLARVYSQLRSRPITLSS